MHRRIFSFSDCGLTLDFGNFPILPDSMEICNHRFGEFRVFCGPFPAARSWETVQRERLTRGRSAEVCRQTPSFAAGAVVLKCK